MMTASDDAIELITTWEGFSAKACKCVSTEKYYTIGYGHYGADVKAGQTITKAEAVKLLKEDVKTAESRVNTYSKKYNFNQHQFDALVSFCYNVGNIKGLTKNGTRTIQQIREAFPLYCRSGGKILRGLQRRRQSELNLFNKVDANQPSPVKTNEELAKEVIRGLWGNGLARKKKLTAAGYDYKAVQAIVNKLMKEGK